MIKRWTETLIISLLFAVSATPLPGRRIPIIYKETEHYALHYLALHYPQAGIRLSEMPYDDGDAERLLPFLKKQGLSRSMVYYLQYLRPHLLFAQSESRGVLHMRNRLNWRNKTYADEAVRFTSDLMGAFRIDPHLSAFFDFQVDTDGASDSDYHGVREWKSLTGDMRTAYIVYNQAHWSLMAGRSPLQWGPGRTGSLLTSAEAPGLDMLKFKCTLGRIQFSAFNARLMRKGALIRGQTSEEDLKINRFFSGHRISYRNKHVELGLQETIMYGGIRASENPAYLNPLMPYYFLDVMQAERDGDNITIAMDAAVYSPGRFRLFGQIVVDEYYYEGEDFPKRTGMLAGADWINVFGNPDLSMHAEYARMDRWLYNYDWNTPWSRLNYFNSILGHPAGSDSDMLRMNMEYVPNARVHVRFSTTWTRHGETDVNTPFYNQELKGLTHADFPYGIVESILRNQLDLTIRLSHRWRIVAEVADLQFTNRHHTTDMNERETRIQVGAIFDTVRQF